MLVRVRPLTVVGMWWPGMLTVLVVLELGVPLVVVAGFTVPVVGLVVEVVRIVAMVVFEVVDVPLAVVK